MAVKAGRLEDGPDIFFKDQRRLLLFCSKRTVCNDQQRQAGKHDLTEILSTSRYTLTIRCRITVGRECSHYVSKGKTHRALCGLIVLQDTKVPVSSAGRANSGRNFRRLRCVEAYSGGTILCNIADRYSFRNLLLRFRHQIFLKLISRDIKGFLLAMPDISVGHLGYNG